MALNDEQEKLSQAEDFLLKYRASSQEFEAALEHLRIVSRKSEDVRRAAKAIVRRAFQARGSETQFSQKMKGFRL